MARTIETVDAADLVGGSGLQAEGKYHFIVVEISDGKTAGDSYLNGLFSKLKVVHGEHKDETFNLDLLDPKMDSKDGGKFARVKQSAFLIAANVVTPSQVNGDNVSYDEQSAAGSQIIAELRLGREGKDGKKYLDLHFSNVYHIDDPRAAEIDKCKDAIGAIPAGFRHDAAWFDAIVGQRKKSATPPPADLDLGGL